MAFSVRCSFIRDSEGLRVECPHVHDRIGNLVCKRKAWDKASMSDNCFAFEGIKVANSQNVRERLQVGELFFGQCLGDGFRSSIRIVVFLLIFRLSAIGMMRSS